ncbi:flagellar synthesis regulator FleN [Aurantivibrio plasticivorans]
MSYSSPIQVIAVTGGKGGVGKTNLAVNLSIALAEMQRRVLLLDADLGLANVDVLLGLKPKKNLSDVIKGDASMQEVIVNGPGGVRIVPASSGVRHMASLSTQEHAALINGFAELGDQLDVLIVDTAAGISDNVISFVRASQEVIVVVCDEPSSITDAYALIKLLNKEHDMFRFKVVANMTRTTQEGKSLFNKLNAACERFLDVALQYVGHIPFDENVRSAVQKQQPLLTFAPRCKASQAIRSLAHKVDEWPRASSATGHLEFFVEHMVSPSVANVSY